MDVTIHVLRRAKTLQSARADQGWNRLRQSKAIGIRPLTMTTRFPAVGIFGWILPRAELIGQPLALITVTGHAVQIENVFTMSGLRRWRRSREVRRRRGLCSCGR